MTRIKINGRRYSVVDDLSYREQRPSAGYVFSESQKVSIHPLGRWANPASCLAPVAFNHWQSQPTR